MKRRSKAGDEPPKARRRTTAARKSRIAPKAVHHHNSSAAREETKAARLDRERDEALQQQRATADVLKAISRSNFDLQVVFETLVESAAKLCKADFADIWRPNGSSYRVAASYQTTAAQKEYLATLPITPGRGSCVGRTLLEAKIVHIPDIREDAEYALDLKELGERRTTLGVPLLRDGKPIGVIALIRNRVRPFTSRQIELVTTFADQAVIAIENARLLAELHQRTTDLTESLEQQTATSEVLGVISRSKFELQPILQSVVDTASQLCRADVSVIFRLEGGVYRFAAGYSLDPAYLEHERQTPISPGPGTIVGRAAMSREVVQIEDAWTDALYEQKAAVKISGGRSMIGVPLMREGDPIGVIGLARTRVEPFTQREIELVTTFADQAVIAIENTRLFEAEQQRTRELSESLEQQTATSEVLSVVSRSPAELHPVFETILQNAVRICGAKFGNLWLREGDFVRIGATYGAPAEWSEFLRREPVFRLDPRLGTARLIVTKQPYQVADIAADPTYGDKVRTATIELAHARSLIGVPLLRDDEVIGIIVIYRQEVRPFTDKQIEVVQNFAAQAVIAIENARLLNELRESLQQQTATADVLKVISRSTFDLQTVLDALLESAARLCAADKSTIHLPEGDVYRIRAHYGLTQEAVEYALLQPLRPGHSSAVGRVALEGKTIQIPDVLADPEYHAMDYQQAFGYRTILGVPLLRDGKAIGTLSLLRDEVSPFTDKQIELVTVFADQAVIAMENARLLTELRESLQQQSATADVLKVISRSAFDLQTVLDTLVESAARLCDADSAAIHRPDGNSYPYVASYGYTREYHEYVRERPIIPGRGTVLGRAVTECKPIQVNDVEADPEYTLREGQRLGGFRTVLGIPLLREGVPIGVLVLTRNTVRPFTDKQIEFATTFADQGAIAIQNVRLFEAEQQRTQELARSLEELRTAQDRLVQTQKLASLGQLTAGIAHEIKNPLNFVNNFSSVSAELLDELRETLEGLKVAPKARSAIAELTDTLRDNLDKIAQHGKRADSIVKNMLLHSREGSGAHRPIDINALVEEAVNLAYHGARAEKQGFNITLEWSIDPTAGQVDCFPQEITRVLLNLISNGFYAATRRKEQDKREGYEPTLTATTKNLGDGVEIRIRDNGTGIAPEVKEKLFSPFFTTKPAGEGTGLGLSISHDIVVKQHAGSIEIDSQPGEYTEVRIVLPRAGTALIKSRERT
jgi:two-component system, NtrC family, sensor kinase